MIKYKCINSRKIFLLLLSLIFIGIACNKKNNPPDERPKPGEAKDSLTLLPEGADKYHVAINPSVKYQTIDNFGASDCWSTQFVGKWPTSKTNTMADWLFSMDTTENGQPLGIGLSSWRFNIGAGSASQGDNSGINDPWRRSECFLLSNGSYNWNRQSGQQRFLTAAKERGVEQFIGFSNSAPIYLTKNGKAYGDQADPENISVNKLPEFADFLIEVVKGIKANTGIELTHISPVNESQWDWTSGSQEGSYMTNNTFRQLVEILDQRMTQTGGLNSKILVTEAGNFTYLYGEGNTLGNQIEYFFGVNSPVNNAPNLAKIVAGHSYHSTTPDSKLINTREQVWNKASTIDGLKVWSSEYCPLGNGDLQALGWSNWHKDLGMDVALYVARIIFHDLVYARASNWQWWLAISPYDYPDGLIYVSKNNTNGTFQDSKLMWALGNYSRFVRPGTQRIKAEYTHDDLYVTAFSNDDNQTTTIVVINYSDNTIPLKLDLDGLETATATPYITSGKDTHKLYPLKKIKLSDGFEMPPRCIITFNI